MSDGDARFPPPREAYANAAALRVAVGPLAGPTILRLVSILASRAQCPLDRLDDALLACDAIIDHAPTYMADGHLALDVTVTHASIELRLGPMATGSGDAIVSEASIPGIGNVLTQVSDRVTVVPVMGGEHLVLGLDFLPGHPAADSPVPLET